MQDKSLQPSYQIESKIGSGSFGQIFSAKDIVTGEQVAIKVEKSNIEVPQLAHEESLYKHLLPNDAKPEGIPKIHQFNTQSDYSLLVMELLGTSLEELFNLCERKFSLKTVLMLADQMISRLEYVHSCGIVHRDIKPENFVLGTGEKQSVVHIIDFGLSKLYMKEGKHASCAKRKSFVGTVRYASINTHKGISQSRRDDLEALFYVWIYFLKGTLPWQGLAFKDRQERYDKIRDKKIEISTEQLCEDLPEEFVQYMTYVKSLEFDEKPDYQKLRNIFKDLFAKQGYVEDFDYDWVLKKRASSISTSMNSGRNTERLQESGEKEPKISVDAKIPTAAKISTLTCKGPRNIQRKEENPKACFSMFSCFL